MRGLCRENTAGCVCAIDGDCICTIPRERMDEELSRVRVIIDHQNVEIGEELRCQDLYLANANVKA